MSGTIAPWRLGDKSIKPSAALAIAAGAHPKAIQSRMGHSSINVTLDRYGHLFPELDESIATAFDAQLSATAQLDPAVVRAVS